jgi:putative phosphoribosyl transferase
MRPVREDPLTERGNERRGPFADRVDAGRALATRLIELGYADAVVVGLPRGGVVVAAEVARILRVPLDIVVVRKIAAPWNPELALGAVCEGGVLVRNEDVLTAIGLDEVGFQAAVAAATAQVADRSRRLRGDRPLADLAGRTVIVVDDGVATGATAAAAAGVVRARGADSVVLAVPVAAPEAIVQLREVADAVVVVDAPPQLGSVGAWYSDFGQVPDDEVLGLLRDAGEGWGEGARPGPTNG